MSRPNSKNSRLGFNGLTAKEWARMTRSVWSDVKVGVRPEYIKLHGATFPEDLAYRLVKLYSPKNGVVLDPFLGTGTTLEASRQLQRKSIGIELYSRFVEIALKRMKQKTLDLFNSQDRSWHQKVLHTEINKQDAKIYLDHDYIIIHGDTRNIDKYLKPESVDLILTSPPYANLIHRIQEKMADHEGRSHSIYTYRNIEPPKPYGDDKRDLGNLSYGEYLETIQKIMNKLHRISRAGSYNIWVVDDYRDLKIGKPLVPLHMNIAKIAEESGYQLVDIIIWDKNRYRKLFSIGFPTKLYININHTYILVFYKSR